MEPTAAQGDNTALIWVLIGCAGFLVLGLCGFSGLAVWLYLDRQEEFTDPFPAPPPPADPTPFPTDAVQETPREITATVTNVTGNAPVQVGTMCHFSVERRPSFDGYWCLTQINCGAARLYGDGVNNGFFNCTLHEQPRRDVVGADTEMTSNDTDAAMQLDTRQGKLQLSDDNAGMHGAYTLEARITDVR